MIRSAGVSDLDSLYELEVACFAERRFQREHLLSILRNPRASTFVYGDDKVLGSLMLLDEDSVVRVLSVGVHPVARRLGIGAQLMALAEDVARRSGAIEIRLEVNTRNDGAVEFYTQLGYEITGTLRRYYSWGDDAYSMRKALAVAVRKT